MAITAIPLNPFIGAEIRGVAFDHCENEEWIDQHVWRPHDMLLWDNRCSMHARADLPEGERRLMLRTTIEAEARPS